MVLNAFRHQRGLHGPSTFAVSRGDTCSTPFGIKEGCTAPCELQKSRWITCSTPFGIKEGCTGFFGFGRGHLLRAQRLSASKRAAQAANPTRTHPYRVLNAFRHQRGLHPPSAHRPCPCLSRAQRLSASKRAALETRAHNVDAINLCSTPFGIKEGCTVPV